MNKTILCVLLGLITYTSSAQTYTDSEIPENSFRGTRFVNGHSVNLADKGLLLFLIQHRFGRLDGGVYELFGLDHATMRLGFEYGLGRNLNVGFGRSSWLKTYDIFAKYRFIQPTVNFPVTVAAVAETSIPTLRNYFPAAHDNLTSKSAVHAQLLLAGAFGRFGFQLSPGYMSTGFLPVMNENIGMFTTGVAGSVFISDMFSVNLEYLHWLHSEFQGAKPLSISVDLTTRGHLFQLILSNSQAMFSQSLYTATPGNWQDGMIYLGFNLIREFRINYYQ